MSKDVSAIDSFGGPFLEKAPKVKNSANFISKDCPDENRENRLRQKPDRVDFEYQICLTSKRDTNERRERSYYSVNRKSNRSFIAEGKSLLTPSDNRSIRSWEGDRSGAI